jgi:uncharacterized membrane protein YgcG
MQTPPSRPRATAFFAVALVASLAPVAASSFAGCTSTDTLTPSCTNNVTANGMTPDDAGCSVFATCSLGAAALCCKAADGGALGSDDLATCLYGYGDPSCPYLQIVYSDMGTEMAYTCVTSPPDGGAGTGGSGGGGGAGGGSSSSSNSSSSSSSSGGGSKG